MSQQISLPIFPYLMDSIPSLSSLIDSPKKLNSSHAIKPSLLWKWQSYIFTISGKTTNFWEISCQIVGHSSPHKLWKTYVPDWASNLSFPYLITYRWMGKWSIWIEISSSISNFSLPNVSTSRQTGFHLHNSPIMQSNRLLQKNLPLKSYAHMLQEWASSSMFWRYQLLTDWLTKLPRLWRTSKTT